MTSCLLDPGERKIGFRVTPAADRARRAHPLVNVHGALIAAVLLSAAAASQGQAQPQVRPATPASAASATVSRELSPPRRTESELRQEAAEPGELRPEHAVIPQIVIPVGRRLPVEPKPSPANARPGKASASGSIDDAAARCRAQVSQQARALCDDRHCRNPGAATGMP